MGDIVHDECGVVSVSRAWLHLGLVRLVVTEETPQQRHQLPGAAAASRGRQSHQ